MGRYLREEMILPDPRERNPGPRDLQMPRQMFVGHVARLSIKLMNVVLKPRRRRSTLLTVMRKPRVTTNQEKIVPILKHFVLPTNIDDDEARNRFLLELKNLILNTDKPKSRPVVEPFSTKQIMNLSNSHSKPSISDLRHEVSSLKEEIKDIKSRLEKVEMDVLTDKVLKKTTLQEPDSDHESTQDNEVDSINNDHLAEPIVTNTGNNPTTSVVPGVTVVSSIIPQSHHIPVKIVVNKHFVINKIALLDSGADRNYIVKDINEDIILGIPFITEINILLI
ncbi:hypothetical protein KY290_011018 [Solanum tuberosum]|uniref:Peptidase A2 domain-containing protein n=1 Tax=Solanum tuberosum TaxID=4113 RepID=A0ABQ7W0P1_SOLTU|nr:hypothetical protein KY290_011018 [Solanum tuberosum]